MDPLTHGVIGLALSAFSGQAVALDNPVSIGAALGAMSPDIDVVSRLFFDDMVYCKHHRGFSHSVPSLAILSAGITFGLSLLFKGMPIGQVFLWTFIGALSHTVFDILNSYGAMLIRKKIKANLLSLYDPVLSVIAFFLIFHRAHTTLTLGVSASIFFVYIGLRLYMKHKAKIAVANHFKHEYALESVDILPSLKLFYKWDFIVHTSSHDIVGNYSQFTGQIGIVEILPKMGEHLKSVFMESNVGKYFTNFTSNYHVLPVEEPTGIVLKVIDLRYHFKGDFMHHAELHLDKSCNVVESYFQPYDVNRRIPVLETA